MPIQSIGIEALQQTKATAPKKMNAVEFTGKFSSMLEEAMNGLNAQEKQVEQLTGAFLRGELDDVHQLTIASQKAALGLELAVQVRNKAVEAYQEIMRMQI